MKCSIASIVQRLDPTLFGQFQGDQVAQHGRPEQAGDAGLAGGLDPHHRGGVRSDRGGGQLKATALAGVLIAVLEEDRREGAVGAGARPAAELVVVGLGQLGEKAGELGVLVCLGLPTARDRRRQVGPVDDGEGVGELAAISSAGEEERGSGLEEGRGGVQLGMQARGQARQRRHLGGDPTM